MIAIGLETSKLESVERIAVTLLTCYLQPYIGFVPESPEYRNVRKEMVRQSSRVAKRLSNSVRNHDSKKQQLTDDINLMVDACPNVRKLNMVIHHKFKVRLTLWPYVCLG